MSRRRRLLLIAAAMLAVAVLASAIATIALWRSPDGARRVVGWLASRAGAELTFTEFSGPIRGPVRVREVVWATDTMRVEVDSLELEWRARALLSHLLDVERLHARGIRVWTAAPDAEEEPDARLPQVRLPVAVVIRDLKVRGFSATAGDAEPFVLDTAEIVTRGEGSRVDVERLHAAGPAFTLAAHGWLEPTGDYPLHLDLEWTAAPDGGPPLAGRGRLWGTMELLRVEHTLTDPAAVATAGAIRTPLRDPRLDLTVTLPGATLSDFEPAWPEARVTATANVAGRPEDLIIALTAVVEGLLPPPATLDGTLRWHAGTLSLKPLSVTLGGTPTVVTLEGTVVPGEPLGFDLTASWRDLVWPLEPNGEPVAPEGRLHLAGSLEAWRLEGAALALAGPLGEAPITATARGGLESAFIETFTAALPPGEVTASGTVSFADEIRWDLDLDAPDLDPARLVPELTGALALSLATQGTVRDVDAAFSVGPIVAAGELAGQPLQAEAAVTVAGGVVHLESLQGRWGAALVEAAGTLGESVEVRAALRVGDLEALIGELVPGAGGAVAANLTLTGPAGEPHLHLEADAEGLAGFHGTVDRLQFQARGTLSSAGSMSVQISAHGLETGEIAVDALDLALDGPASFRLEDLPSDGDFACRLTARGVRYGDTTADRVTLTLDGSPSRHSVELAATAQEGEVLLALAGGLVDGEWNGAVSRLDLDWPPVGAWELADSAPVRAAADAAEVHGLALIRQDARVQVAGRWQADAGWRGEVAVTELPLNLVAPWLPDGTVVTGTISGSALAEADADERLTAALDLATGGVTFRQAGETEARAFTLESFTLTAAAGAAGARADLRADLGPLGAVTGWLALPDWAASVAAPPGSTTLRGRVDLEVADLGVTRAFTRAVREPGGRLHAHLDLSGTVAAPEVRGKAVLADGQVRLPDIGITPRDGELTITAEGGRVTATGSVRSGDGQVHVTGGGPFSPSTDDPLRLRVEGERFLAADLREARVEVAPRLDLAISGRQTLVTGEVTVPRARIEFKSVPAGAVATSPDVVVVGGDVPPPAADPAMAVTARVRLVLGADVSVAAMGLQGHPRGSLLVVEEPGRPTTATGTLELLDGTFKAYGQDLTIERGRLIYAGGPVDNPGLDLRAYRRADDGTVAGVAVSGSARDPRVTLWSEPAMNQSEQLAYLLLGRPLHTAGAGETASLDDAALMAGLKGGDLLARRLGAGLGLEEARIETGRTVEDASLVLGTYLSPRLYVAYGVGLFQPVNTFRLRYRLGRLWTLQAEGSGTGSGADLLHSFETGCGAADLPRPSRP